MPQETRDPFDWTNKNNLRHRAWQSVKEFFGGEEEEHPLSPGQLTGAEGGAEPPPPPEREAEEDPNAERIHRETEQRKLKDNPATMFPG
jgi:hypothetical protein